MARAATTSDAFNAVAERRRRELIDVLALSGRAHAVGELVRTLRMRQPTVSKHLGVLRAVGLVRVRRRGRNQLYTLNAEALRPVQEWIKTFEHFWTDHLDQIKQAAEKKAAAKKSPSPAAPKSPGVTIEEPQ